MANLTQYQKQTEIPNAIKKYLEEKDSNQAQLSRDAGIGAAYVSTILKGETMISKSPIKDKYYLALCKAIGYNIEVKIWRHFNTDNFKTIVLKIKEARANKSRATIDADTGAGKTYACKMYKQKYPNGTFVVKCSAIENSKEFAVNIAEVVGVETHGTAGKIIKRVAKKLLSMDDAALIIDEAEHIGKKSGYINIIKSIADLLEDEVCFVLLGMGINDILKKGFDRNKQNFRQTARRFSDREKCVEGISDDVRKIAQELGFSKVVQNWLANRIHNFDELKSLVIAAITEAKKISQPVTIELLNKLYI